MMLPAREAGTRIRKDTSGPTEHRLSVPSVMGKGSFFSFLRDMLIVDFVNLDIERDGESRRPQKGRGETENSIETTRDAR